MGDDQNAGQQLRASHWRRCGRLSILALAWLCLQASQSPSKDVAFQKKEALSPANKAAARNFYEAPCRGNKDDLQSDLCAQWTAANAAKAAARASWVSVLVGGIGALAVFLTVFQTRSLMRIDKRPRLHIRKVDMVIHAGEGTSGAFLGDITIANKGETAAINIVVRWAITKSFKEANNRSIKVPMTAARSTNILPGENEIVFALKVAEMEDAVGASGECYALIVIDYENPDGGGRHFTEQVWMVADSIFRGTPTTLSWPKLGSGIPYHPELQPFTTRRLT